MRRARGVAVGAAVALAGCVLRPPVKPAGDPEVGVGTRWWGHSCFSFRDSVGRVLLVDPFDETVGYPAPPAKADARLVTHEHFDHDRPFPPEAMPVVRSTGVHTVAGIAVRGFLVDHDDEGGRRHGRSRAYVWEMGGVRFAHLGDIGQTDLRAEQRDALAGVDVLFVPVGGSTTVDARGAARLVRAVGPRVAVPMHFGTSRVRFYIFDPVDPFAALFSESRRLPPGEFRFRRADLPAETTIWIPTDFL